VILLPLDHPRATVRAHADQRPAAHRDLCTGGCVARDLVAGRERGGGRAVDPDVDGRCHEPCEVGGRTAVRGQPDASRGTADGDGRAPLGADLERVDIEPGHDHPCAFAADEPVDTRPGERDADGIVRDEVPPRIDRENVP
jgi:hypothetical protein